MIAIRTKNTSSTVIRTKAGIQINLLFDYAQNLSILLTHGHYQKKHVISCHSHESGNPDQPIVRLRTESLDTTHSSSLSGKNTSSAVILAKVGIQINPLFDYAQDLSTGSESQDKKREWRSHSPQDTSH